MKSGFGFLWWGGLAWFVMDAMACFPELPPEVDGGDEVTETTEVIGDVSGFGDQGADFTQNTEDLEGGNDGNVLASCRTESECDDGLTCTSDQCKPNGECAHVQLTGSCLIDQKCYQAGVRNELNTCQVCSGGDAWTTLSPLDCVPVCGDGLVTGDEGCDDGGELSGDGCSAICEVETGYECVGGLSVCRTRCGDAIRAAAEQCDDGNASAGDGCDGQCKTEQGYACGSTGCQPICGDGWSLRGEDCDDGNVQAGDGCNPFCQVEAGWACREIAWGDGTLLLPLTVFDFKAQNEVDGHPDFQTYLAHQPQLSLVEAKLGNEDVPVFVHRGDPAVLTGVQEFQQWYRHVPGTNISFERSIALSPDGGEGAYVYDNQAFFPIDDMGFGNYAGYSHNYHFTSVTRWRFVYRGGERITFTGDDDVWVFVNRHLAIDLGGTHLPATGSILLSNALEPATNQRRDAQFDLAEGGIYEVLVFHAERYITQSTFRLRVQMTELNGNTSRCTRQ